MALDRRALRGRELARIERLQFGLGGVSVRGVFHWRFLGRHHAHSLAGRVARRKRVAIAVTSLINGSRWLPGSFQDAGAIHSIRSQQVATTILDHSPPSR